MIPLPGFRERCKPGAAAADSGSRVLLIHPTGADGGTGITDVFGHSVTVSGNAQIDDAVVKFSGSRSVLLDGSGDYLTIADSADWDVGATDKFTIDLWANQGPQTGTQCLFGLIGTTTANSLYIYVEGASPLNFLKVYANGAFRITGGGMALNEWKFIRLTKDGDSHKLYLNGAQAGSTYTASLSCAPTQLMVGNDGLGSYARGSYQEIRFTKGAALSGADVPTAIFPDT
jgi:hypothetical protein